MKVFKIALRAFGVGSVVALLAGCTGWNVDKLNEAQPAGTAFTNALYNEYKTLVKGEVNQVDWHAADYFAKKGLAAAGGTVVMPEDPADWEVRGESMDALMNLRAKLIEVLDTRGRQYRPDIAARAQVSYDCLVEQNAGHESHQPMHMKHCRDSLLAALAALEAPMAKNFVVFFDFNKSYLNKEAKKQVEMIAQEASRFPDWFINLEGHADTVGSQGYNVGLAMRRADSVRRGLMRQGVGNHRIYTSGHGETRLAVPTADGTKEQRNRRVEVNLSEQR